MKERLSGKESTKKECCMREKGYGEKGYGEKERPGLHLGRGFCPPR